MKRRWLVFFLFLLGYGLSIYSCVADKDSVLDNIETVPADRFYTAFIYATIDGIGNYLGYGAQGFAVYNNVGFCFYDCGYCQTIDLDRKRIIASFELPTGVANPYNHCGVSCFSNYFYKSEDKYPLLYLSSYKENKCYVLRMTENSAELVQILQMRDEQGNIISNYAFMPDDDLLLLKANFPTKQDGYYTYIWKIVNRPDITEEINTYLMPCDVLSSFSVKSSDAYNAGFCRNGMIYQIAGYNGYGSKKLYIIDYKNGIILKEVIWEEPFLYKEEHEQCCPFGENGMLINYNFADYISYIRFNNWKYE